MKTKPAKKIKLTFFDGSVATFDRPEDTPADVVEARQQGHEYGDWQLLDARGQVRAGPLVPTETFWEAFEGSTKWRARRTPTIKTMKANQRLCKLWEEIGDTSDPEAWPNHAAYWTAGLQEVWYEERQRAADEAGNFISSRQSGNYVEFLRESTGPGDKCITDALGMEDGYLPGFLIYEEDLAELGFKVCVLDKQGKPISILEAAVRKAGFSAELYNKEARSINAWFRREGSSTRLPLIRKQDTGHTTQRTSSTQRQF